MNAFYLFLFDIKKNDGEDLLFQYLSFMKWEKNFKKREI